MTVVDLHVREAGEGLPLVLLHAFPLSSAMWLEQRNDLSDLCRVITPDLRGFGGSQLGDDEPSMDRMADDVVALLDRLDLDRVVLGGLSMGGYVTMALLRRHADRVRGLMLADTKATADAAEARAKRIRIAGTLREEATGRILAEEVLPTLCGETTRQQRPLVLGRVRALLEAAPPLAAAWAQEAMAARGDSLDVLRAVPVAAVVVRGDEDELSTQADAEAMVEALGDAALEVLPGAGHLSAVETPAAFSAAVRELVGRVTEAG
jgi:pimeloyl-ACP methyl ester carboxylesterase